jgi:D-alanine-D-alanine ligase
MEINPIAGLHPKDSDLPMIANSSGMTYRDLIEQIVEAAAQRLDRTKAIAQCTL